MRMIRFNARPDFSALMNPYFEGEFNDCKSHVPAANILEEEDAFVVELAAPGLKKEDFNLAVEDDLLTISVKLEKTKEDLAYKRREFSSYSFSRSFRLGDVVNQDEISGTYTDGILRISLPKVPEAKQKLRREIALS